MQSVRERLRCHSIKNKFMYLEINTVARLY
jgi:hypothetical protein